MGCIRVCVLPRRPFSRFLETFQSGADAAKCGTNVADTAGCASLARASEDEQEEEEEEDEDPVHTGTKPDKCLRTKKVRIAARNEFF